MRFFPREKGETAFVEGFSVKKADSPFARGKNRISQGVENRGSLISVPLALREVGFTMILVSTLLKVVLGPSPCKANITPPLEGYH